MYLGGLYGELMRPLAGLRGVAGGGRLLGAGEVLPLIPLDFSFDVASMRARTPSKNQDTEAEQGADASGGEAEGVARRQRGRHR